MKRLAALLAATALTATSFAPTHTHTQTVTAHYEQRTALKQATPDKQTLREALTSHGLRASLIDSALAGAQLDERVINRYNKPRTTQYRSSDKSFEERVQAVINHPNYQRVNQQLPHHALQHLDELLALEQTTGVDYRYITAIHGLESRFGEVTGEHQLINTYLSRWHVTPGSRQVQRELRALLAWTDKNRVDATQLNTINSSWASAFGAMQTRAENLHLLEASSLEELNQPRVAHEFIATYLTQNYRWGANSNWRRTRNHQPLQPRSGNALAIQAYNNSDVYVQTIIHLAEQLPTSQELTP